MSYDICENINKSTPSPFSVQCTSTTGQLFKISACEFDRKILKEAETEAELFQNLLQKYELLKKKEISVR